MTPDFYYKLESAICNAKNAAREYENIEDGGTCNFDSPIIHLEKADKKQLAMMDFEVSPIGGRGWKDWYFVNIPLSGQGARRTKMAEAAAESLKADGYDAMVYYQMD